MKYIIIGLLVLVGVTSASAAASSSMVDLIPDDQQDYCLTEAVYFEAGNQPFIGKMAVAYVVLNRVSSDKYPDDICDVIRQGPIDKNGNLVPVLHKCQFSYYCDGKVERPDYQSPAWRDSLLAAKLSRALPDYVTNGATHYHATYVNPFWADKLRRTVQLEDHIFYK